MNALAILGAWFLFVLIAGGGIAMTIDVVRKARRYSNEETSATDAAGAGASLCMGADGIPRCECLDESDLVK